MLPAPMNRFLAACILLLIGMAPAAPLRGQDTFAGVDLLYPEFAHPQKDALAASKERDFRFIMIDRRGTVPGIEAFPRLREVFGTKFIRQRFRIFATRSQNFSFHLRARTYAYDYNQTLLAYLQKLRRSENAGR